VGGGKKKVRRNGPLLKVVKPKRDKRKGEVRTSQMRTTSLREKKHIRCELVQGSKKTEGGKIKIWTWCPERRYRGENKTR